MLSLLDKQQEMRISDIAAKMGYADSNVSGIVDRLENAGFVKRSRSDTDRRIVKVSLTDKAYELKKDFSLNLEEYFSRFMSMTTQKELQGIAENLEKLKLLLACKDTFPS